MVGQNVTNIQWWFAPGSVDENATQLTESSKYTLVPTVSAEGLEVQLTISDLGDEDVGTYWCQASVEDKSGLQLLSTSESVELQEMSWFEMNLITNKCMHVLRNADTRCASILITPPSSVITTTQLPDSPTHSSVVYPSPSPAPEPVSATAPSGLFQTSSIILYAVLGLVGFLAIACVLLIIIVAMLCRRKCARHNMKGKKYSVYNCNYNVVDLPHIISIYSVTVCAFGKSVSKVKAWLGIELLYHTWQFVKGMANLMHHRSNLSL